MSAGSLVDRGAATLDAWLPAEHFPAGSEPRRRARLIALLALGASVGALPYAPMFASAGCTRLALTSLSFPLAFVVALAILRRGHVARAGAFVVATFGAQLVVQGAGTGGLQSPPLWCLPTVVALAQITVGGRARTWAAGLASLVALGFGVAALATGPLRNPLPPNPVADASVLVVLSWLTIWIMSTFERVEQEMRQALAARRAEADAAHRHVRAVLDSVEEGIVLLDPEGRVAPGHSRSAERLLGEVVTGAPFAECVARLDPRVGALFALGWEAVVDDLLPLELNLAQLPSRVVVGARTLALEYHAVPGAALSVVVTVSDVSAEVAQEQAERGQRELYATFVHLSRDRVSYQWFLRETTAAVDRLAEGGDDLAAERRALHTVKGNAGFFGLAGFVAQCHALETSSLERQGPLTPDERAALGASWREVLARVSGLVDLGAPRVELDPDEHRAFVEAIARGDDRASLEAVARSWTLERARRPLTFVGDQARALATRLGRGELDVEVLDGGVRLDAERWAPFWSSLTHVVRNAVDHGIEAAEARRAMGKRERGRITLRCDEDASGVVIEVSDDGRGVDWDRIRARAARLGLPTSGPDDLREAMFADGVSTRDEVTETSGRGVGMSAVATATRRLGGRIAVVSESERGTTLRFEFQRSAVRAARGIRSGAGVARRPSTRRPKRAPTLPPPAR